MTRRKLCDARSRRRPAAAEEACAPRAPSEGSKTSGNAPSNRRGRPPVAMRRQEAARFHRFLVGVSFAFFSAAAPRAAAVLTHRCVAAQIVECRNARRERADRAKAAALSSRDIGRRFHGRADQERAPRRAAAEAASSRAAAASAATMVLAAMPGATTQRRGGAAKTADVLAALAIREEEEEDAVTGRGIVCTKPDDGIKEGEKVARLEERGRKSAEQQRS